MLSARTRHEMNGPFKSLQSQFALKSFSNRLQIGALFLFLLPPLLSFTFTAAGVERSVSLIAAAVVVVAAVVAAVVDVVVFYTFGSGCLISGFGFPTAVAVVNEYHAPSSAVNLIRV